MKVNFHTSHLGLRVEGFLHTNHVDAHSRLTDHPHIAEYVKNGIAEILHTAAHMVEEIPKKEICLAEGCR